MSATTSGVVFTPSGDDTHMRLYRGKTLRFEIIWGGETPINITGYSAALQARSHNNSLLLDLSTENGGMIIDGPNGKITVLASASITRDVHLAGRYEIELTSANDEVFRIMSGRLSIIEEIVK